MTNGDGNANSDNGGDIVSGSAGDGGDTSDSSSDKIMSPFIHTAQSCH